MVEHRVIPSVEYRCPGRAYAISRAVHLGRLAGFDPACRRCQHGYDTGTLSARTVKQLAETRPRGLPQPRFSDEVVCGVYRNELDPQAARRLAAAFGVSLRRSFPAADPPPDAAAQSSRRDRSPVVVIAGDGRALSCELVAGVGEGLRWAGCHLVDAGPATAACLAFAAEQLKAAGAVLVGNPDGRPQMVGLKFWAPAARPLSRGGRLDRLKRFWEAGVDRPTRTYGSLQRFQPEGLYLSGFQPYFHGLRPLRFVLDTPSAPLGNYLGKLTEATACRFIPCRAGAQRLGDRVRAEQAHFGTIIADDGEIFRLADEQGRWVPAERTLRLIATHLSKEGSPPAIVLEAETDPTLVEAARAMGCHVVSSDARRAAMEQTMRTCEARFGGGPSGRFWYADDGLALPDALKTLALLLVILSQSDRGLSEVLDRAEAFG